jgi:hypothetical protein
MDTQRIFILRAFIALTVLSLVFSNAGVQSAYASMSQVSGEAQPETLTATLDQSVHLDSFPASSKFILHFSETMNPESSPSPLLTYPYSEGESSWNAANDTLTFSPVKPLKTGETYLFFLDPTLSSVTGTLFDTSPQWSVQVLGGTQVVGISPKAGLLTTRRPVI